MTERTTLLCSPSQANTAKLCRRLWGFRYLDKIRSPSTPSQARGTALHTVGENWLRDGEVPPDTEIGRRFLAGVHHLPQPSPDVLVEHEFLFEDGDVHWRGFIDCVDPTGDMITVIDHKSTKNFYWAKKPEDLKTDTQGIVYAKVTMEKFKVDVVEARWVYYLMEGQPQSKKVSVILKKEHVDKQYQGLKILGEELLEIKKTTTTGLDISVQYPNGGCRAFGGCDFGEVCAAKERGQETMSDLLSRLKKMKDNGVDQNVQALHAAVNPPTTVEKKPEPAKVTTRTTVAVAHDYIDPNAAVGSSEVAMQAVDHGPTETVSCEEPAPKAKRRGRPKGSKNKKKAAAEVVTDTTGPSVESLEFDKAPAVDTLTLYIDCIPDSGATSVNKLVEQAAERAAAANEVDHYRLIPYGGGAGSLCAALKEIVESDDSLKGSWFATTHNQMHKDALPALEAMAAQVVRGTR